MTARAAAAFMTAVVCLGSWAAPAEAKTFAVSTTLDLVDTAPGDGVCEATTGQGDCTLRAAIQEANASLDATDHVVLGAGTYTLSIAGVGEDAAAKGDLDVKGTHLLISGAGAVSTIVDAGGLDRAFQVNPSSSASTTTSLTLVGATVRGGRPPASAPGATSDATQGGGIQANADLTVEDSVLTDNRTHHGGGGIFKRGGELTIRRSSLTQNSAGNSGGGALYLGGGTTTIEDSLLSGNSTAASGGGAIYNWSPGLTIRRSTLMGNVAVEDGGGGIFNRGPLTLTDSTLSGNVATGGDSGGGIQGWGGGATIENSTLSGNSASGGGGGFYGAAAWTIVNTTITGNSGGSAAGGIQGGSLTIKNSIVAGNTGGDCNSITATKQGHNLQSSPAAAFGNCGFDLVSTSPGLGTLQANGGTTNTHALLPGSPAIDAGSDCPPPASDQRGVVRSVPCDLGAYEAGGQTAPVVTIVAPPSLGPDAGPFTIDATIHNGTGATLENLTARLVRPAGISLDSGADSGPLGPLGVGGSVTQTWNARAATDCADRSRVYSVELTWTGGGPHIVPATLFVQGQCGSISGRVSAVGVGLVANAEVDVCRPGAGCVVLQTDANGAYSASGLASGDYTVTAHPPTPSQDPLLHPVTLGPIAVAPRTAITQNLVLTHLHGPPPGSLFPGNRQGEDGVPQISSQGGPFELPGCAGGSGSWQLLRGGVLIASGALTEISSGRYRGVIPVVSGGYARMEHSIACPDGSQQTPKHDIYIDPSGFVRDADGRGLAGATVTLYRSASAGGPWEVVANGSQIMSPINRRNPDTTDSSGHFGWDVLAGFYKVAAQKAGCGSVESRVMEIPPPVTDLELALNCAATPPSPPPPPALPPPASPPAPPTRPPASPKKKAPVRITICHRRTKTMKVTKAQLRKHLKHGDKRGRCKPQKRKAKQKPKRG